MVAPFYTPTHSAQDFHFLPASSPTLVIFCSFNSGHPNGYEVIEGEDIYKWEGNLKKSGCMCVYN